MFFILYNVSLRYLYVPFNMVKKDFLTTGTKNLCILPDSKCFPISCSWAWSR